MDKVGYPAIDQTGVVRSVEDDRFAFWGAIGYTQGAAGTHVERMMYSSLGGDYPRCKAAGDEEGMALAQRKGEFYETLLSWIKSNEPSGRPMTAVPEWLLPFVELKA